MSAKLRLRGNFFYGWAIVAIAFTSICVSRGVLFSFSVFFVYMIEEFNWSRATAAGALSLNMILMGAVAPFVGYLTDRLGPRVVLPIGALIFSSGLVLAGTIDDLWTLYLSWGLLMGVGGCMSGIVPATAMLSRWFIRKRATAMGFAMAGAGIGVFIFVPLAQYLITIFGWRPASAVLAIIVLTVMAPLGALFARSSPETMGLAPDGALSMATMANAQPLNPPRAALNPGDNATKKSITPSEALRTSHFWLIFVSFTFTPIAMFIITPHQVAHIVDVGFSKETAATAIAIWGALSAFGRVFFGYLADRMRKEHAAAISFIVAILGIFFLVALRRDSTFLLYAFAITFGLGFGARGPVVSAMAADLFPGRSLGTILGYINVGNGLGSAIGPWLSGYIHDIMGSYRIAFLTSAACLAVAGVATLLAGRPVRRRRQ